MDYKGYFGKVCYADSIPYSLWGNKRGKSCSFTKFNLYPAFRQKGEDRQKHFLTSAVPQLSSDQNNPHVKVAYFEVAYTYLLQSIEI